MDEFINIGEEEDEFYNLDDGFDLNCMDDTMMYDTSFDDLKYPVVDVFLKAAKSREDAYESGDFPTSMLCAPYKYHLKIVGHLPSNSLAIKLVFSDNFSVPCLPRSEKKPVVMDECNVFSPTQRVIKFSLNICSFHYGRKEFRLIVGCGNQDIFTSTPFRTYARRRSRPKQNKTPPVVDRSFGSSGHSRPLKSRPMSRPNDRLSTSPPQMMGSSPPQHLPRSVMNQNPFERRNIDGLSNYQNRRPVIKKDSMEISRNNNVAPPQNYDMNGLNNLQRYYFAVQLLNSMSPTERQAVMNCANYVS